MADNPFAAKVVEEFVVDENLLLDLWIPIWIAAERAEVQMTEETGVAVLAMLADYEPSRGVFRKPPPTPPVG